MSLEWAWLVSPRLPLAELAKKSHCDLFQQELTLRALSCLTSLLRCPIETLRLHLNEDCTLAQLSLLSSRQGQAGHVLAVLFWKLLCPEDITSRKCAFIGVGSCCPNRLDTHSAAGFIRSVSAEELLGATDGDASKLCSWIQRKAVEA